MDTPTESRALLDALGEPAMLVDAVGRIALANAEATRRFGPGAGDLAALCETPEAAAALLAHLRSCAGVATPLPGAVTLRTADDTPARFRTACCALRAPGPGGERLLLLRLAPGGDERFAALAAKVDELNREIRDRRRAQLRLEAALRERDLLLRELHHRVKNNIHLLTGILAAARRESAGRDAGLVLADVAQRLSSVAAVHQMLYLEGRVAHVRGRDFIAKVASQVLAAAGRDHRLELEVAEAILSNEIAVPLALILNELLTNAAKHAIPPCGQPLAVHIRLTASGPRLALEVADNGPGLRPDTAMARRGSGLGLVDGLARQIGGAFATRPRAGGGLACIVEFPETAHPGPTPRRETHDPDPAE